MLGEEWNSEPVSSVPDVAVELVLDAVDDVVVASCTGTCTVIASELHAL